MPSRVIAAMAALDITQDVAEIEDAESYVEAVKALWPSIMNETDKVAKLLAQCVRLIFLKFFSPFSNFDSL